MKKLINFVLAIVAMITMSACSMGDTPSNTVKSAYSCVIDEKYDDFVNYLYFDDENATAEQKEMFKAMGPMLKKAMQEEVKKNGKLKSIEIIEEKVEGDNATVKFKEIYEKKEKEETANLKKTKDGWKMVVK